MRCLRNSSSYSFAQYPLGSHLKGCSTNKPQLPDTNNTNGGIGPAIQGTLILIGLTSLIGIPSRNTFRRIPCRVWKQQVRNYNAVNQRCTNRVSLNSCRHNSLRSNRNRTNRALLSNCGRNRIILHINPDSGQNNRRILETRSKQRKRSVTRPRRPQMAHHPQRCLAHRQSRAFNRNTSCSCPNRRRNRPINHDYLG